MMKSISLALLLALTACALPPPDQPAHFARMGRFMGLIANCGCSNISEEQMIGRFAEALGGRYSADDIRKMEGYVKLGAGERWDNRVQICTEVCSQHCMVQSVVEPLGGQGTGVAACLVNERDLHLTDGTQIGSSNSD